MSFDVAPDRRVRMMSDYSGPPLWSLYGGVDGEALGIPAPVSAELDAWQDLFDTGFHFDTGWRSDDLAREYEAEGRRLLPLVAAALPGFLVELDLWPVREEKVSAGGWFDGWTPPPPRTDGQWTAYRPDPG
ncbi:hypothetical protein GCM10009551_050640 [Nocardiopsis tropica]|uniref:hypothetical protein n=1 Tax=Tsukamurella strandjordii TaxID=147577 RepID=UPI0031E0458E